MHVNVPFFSTFAIQTVACHLRPTYCQHSLHGQTLLPVGFHAALLPFGTVFLHSYALLTASLVLGQAQDLHVRKLFVAGMLSAPLMPNYPY